MGEQPGEGEYFNTLDYFCRQPDECISSMAMALAEDTAQLSTNQARQYVPEEQRLCTTVPRAINELKNAQLLVEKEALLRALESPETAADPERMRQVMTQLSELHALEKLFAKALGGRILSK